MSRYIFTDKFNSLAHFVLGTLSIRFPILIFLFLFYQIVGFLIKKDDFLIDVSEFILGIITCYAIIKTF
jgi:hypothetical protein